ncbi:MAG: class I SAM-dependent methyltransferase [Bacteroidetes bacterium]|nr:class I SAM-dependent methyltransferase [Bacteroidota bacterium]MBU2584505.1 class I SAM-dependent methyltransferase [Bacteroidota bacterium]
MFNNLFNKYDFVRVAEKIRQGYFYKILFKLTSRKLSRVKESWKHTETNQSHWWDIPAIITRWNLLITGIPDLTPHEYFSRKYFSLKKNLKGLSIGCGTGQNELKWVKSINFERLVAHDLSSERIAFAKGQAEKEGESHVLHFLVSDFFDLEVIDNEYDVIIAEGALHHLKPINEVLFRIKRMLKKDGYLIVNDYIGPSRFQWTDRQLEIVNGLLAIIPQRYRKRIHSGTIKSQHYKPGRLSMIVNDPSEAAESSQILPLLKEYFNIVELKEYGGTVLHILMHEIAHNFILADKESEQILHLCFEVEDSMLKLNEVQSDYVFLIAQKKP